MTGPLVRESAVPLFAGSAAEKSILATGEAFSRGGAAGDFDVAPFADRALAVA